MVDSVHFHHRYCLYSFFILISRILFNFLIYKLYYFYLIKINLNIFKLRKRLNNFYQLNRIKYYNIYDLPKGVVGFVVQRILYGEFKEIILIFN